MNVGRVEVLPDVVHRVRVQPMPTSSNFRTQKARHLERRVLGMEWPVGYVLLEMKSALRVVGEEAEEEVVVCNWRHLAVVR